MISVESMPNKIQTIKRWSFILRIESHNIKFLISQLLYRNLWPLSSSNFPAIKFLGYKSPTPSPAFRLSSDNDHGKIDSAFTIVSKRTRRIVSVVTFVVKREIKFHVTGYSPDDKYR